MIAVWESDMSEDLIWDLSFEKPNRVSIPHFLGQIVPQEGPTVTKTSF